ncbi:MAG: hypothetical protein MUE94_12465 [Verrucomicrobia bacterium]|jgi:hypothetical protein|nr:hypothetical protein [Verrucomicrobiota bacterium]
MERTIDTSRVAVVIPTYRSDLKPLEVQAVRQAVTVLGAYDFWLAAPKGLNTDQWKEWLPRIQICEFDPYFFSTYRAYSHLCRTEQFYARLSAYDYMLIYQTDAYVFRDELLDWCSRGYDYVGAPNLNYEFRTHSKKRWTQWWIWRPFLSKVGNGGFSLRKVETFRRASRWLRWTDPFLPDIPEDVFWCSVARHLYPMRIPGWREALQFAFDATPSDCLKAAEGRLPFGCHAWNTVYLDFWKQFIPLDEPRI